MKHFCAAAGFLLLLAQPALAQVTVNQAALRQLAGIEPPPVVEAFASPVAVVHHHRHHVAALAAPKFAAPAQVAAHVVPHVLPHVVPHAVPPMAPEAVTATAPARPAAAKPASPVALVFAPGSADLPADAGAKLKPFCAAPGQVPIDARAPTDPSDPSAAMRLSLLRAIAVQQALAACGVPGQNILPRALGDIPGANEDETVIGAAGAKH